MCATRQNDERPFVRGTTERVAEAERPTVLVVDDDPQVASLAGAYLKRLEADVTVLVETAPEDALARFEAGAVDCVVSDYEMPGMDGLDLLAAVRERDGSVPFVVFTGTDDDSVVECARERGAVCLRKEGDAGGFDRLSDRVAREISRE